MREEEDGKGRVNGGSKRQSWRRTPGELLIVKKQYLRASRLQNSSSGELAAPEERPCPFYLVNFTQLNVLLG